jgi:hypothetical protein
MVERVVTVEVRELRRWDLVVGARESALLCRYNGW